MKIIFEEAKTVKEELTSIREVITVRVKTIAFYDATVRVLVVDSVAESTFQDSYALPQPPEKNKRVLETIETEALAIRRAVGLADEWAGFHEKWSQNKNFERRNKGR